MPRFRPLWWQLSLRPATSSPASRHRIKLRSFCQSAPLYTRPAPPAGPCQPEQPQQQQRDRARACHLAILSQHRPCAWLQRRRLEDATLRPRSPRCLLQAAPQPAAGPPGSALCAQRPRPPLGPRRVSIAARAEGLAVDRRSPMQAHHAQESDSQDPLIHHHRCPIAADSPPLRHQTRARDRNKLQQQQRLWSKLGSLARPGCSKRSR